MLLYGTIIVFDEFYPYFFIIYLTRFATLNISDFYGQWRFKPGICSGNVSIFSGQILGHVLDNSPCVFIYLNA
jgi:hypothetical protein